MPRPYETIVIGLGSMGAAACAELARRSDRILGIDRFTPPHTSGSHHGTTRLFRKAYFEHPDYVPLLQRGAELWERLNADSGSQVYFRTGGLFAGPPTGQVVQGTLESARLHGLAVDELSARDVAAKFPQFRVPRGYRAVFDHDAAVVLSEGAISAMLRLARSRGAETHTAEEVLSIEANGAGVKVRTDAATYEAGSVVVTSGAWTSRLIGALGVNLVVSRQVLGWVRERDAGVFRLGRCPAWGVENEDGSLSYGAPIMPGEPGAKVAVHARGVATDPDSVDRAIHESDTAPIYSTVDRYLPGLCSELVQTHVCLYTNSPDSHFIIDRLPGTERVVVACGFSGHGFKFAPVVGEVLADLAMTGTTAHQVAFLSLSRFKAPSA